ncbi:MAG: hypothetical protein GXY52_02245 [Chloroflexi bacterium]|nr:hypothetical protein [Chloroflexota bacterium]
MVVVLLGVALRLHRLGEPVLRWDEGWSLAHASLPWRDLVRIGMQEWHPPLYIALLKLWRAAGNSAWWLRLLSVLFSLTGIPLVYLLGRDWSGDRRVGLMSAFFMAVYPLVIYYAQVTRMYALAATSLVLTAWCLERAVALPSWRRWIALVAAALTALYTFYLSAWALLGLWIYGMLRYPKRALGLLAAGVALLAGYLPWLWLSFKTVSGWLGEVSLFGPGAWQETLANIPPALQGLAFTYAARPYVWLALVVIVVAGLIAGLYRRARTRLLILPITVLVIGVLGVAFSARIYWFAVRHLMPIVPFLGLLIAWALVQLGRIWKPLRLVAIITCVWLYWPASSAFVYEKTLEVTGPFDPAADYTYLHERATASDLVFFNVLARAGWYENHRNTAEDAPWSYALSWDPIIEPIEVVAERIQCQAHPQQRLWFAQYQGSYGSNAPQVAWLAQHLYPAGEEWLGDEMLYLRYCLPGELGASVNPQSSFGQLLRLDQARWNARLRADQALAVELAWREERALPETTKVFVHLVDEQGHLIAQHDGPVPASTPSGDVLIDRHALFMPRGLLAVGTRLELWVGCYDAVSGERLTLPDGQDHLVLATLTIE